MSLLQTLLPHRRRVARRGVPLVAVVAAVLLSFGAQAQPAPVPLVPPASAVLDWAEAAYAPLFPTSARTQPLPPYVYRYYPGTGNFTGLSDDGGVWLFGPVAGNPAAPVRIGSSADFACLIYPAQCSTGSSYPDKAITVVVPFAAGGPTDLVARNLAPGLSQRLGRDVVINNVGGRDGITGAARVAAAAADGHTLLLHNSALAITPTAYRNSTPDAAAFVPVGVVSETPMVLLARKTLPASDWPSLKAWVASQAAPGGRALFVHAGYGSLPHACLAMLQPLLGAAVTEQRYLGTAPALNDLIGGAVDLLCLEAGVASTYVANGQVKAIAQTGATRSPLAALANVPTLQESGQAGFSLLSWTALLAPKSTPPVVLERLDAALRAAAEDATFRQRQQAQAWEGIDDARAGAVGAARFLQSETSRIGDALRAQGRYVE